MPLWIWVEARAGYIPDCMPVRTYSAGMRLRLAFAIATARDPDILLLDEAIGAGDATFVNKAFARLSALVHRSSILVIASHSEGVIRKLCNKAIWLHNGSLEEFGDVENVLESYARMREAQPTQANAAVRRAKDLVASVADRRRRHAGEKPGKMIVEQPAGWSFYR